MCGYVDGYLRQNGYRFALRDGPRIEEPLDNPPADGQSHLPPPPPSPGGAGLSLLHRELLPVNCAESYSRSATPRATRSATPRATPGQLHRELLPVCYTESYPVCYTESYSRSATPRSIAPRATPGLLHRELLPVCYTESYSRSIAPRVTPGLLLFNKSRSVEKGVKAKFRQLFFVNNDRPCLTKKRPHTIPSRDRGSQTLWLQRELLPVCYNESYSRFTETAACN
jgi:hypothetical protein